MSDSSKRGKSLELQIARILRSKLKVRVHRDSRSGAGPTNKSDIKDWFRETRLAIEAKAQKTLAIKQWFRQADAASSSGQVPTVVFESDGELLACLRFTDLVDFVAEIKQGEVKLDDLRQPAPTPGPPSEMAKAVHEASEAAARAVQRGARTCREGHIADEYGYCQDKHCKYRRGYRAPRGGKR